MVRKRQQESTSTVSRIGGVNIEGSHVAAGGDIVGGDKLTLSGDDSRLDALFRDLVTAINSSPSIGEGQRTEILAKSKQLRGELAKPEPDLGTLASLKSFLASQGANIATAAGAIFQYPPMQTTLKTLTERFLGA